VAGLHERRLDEVKLGLVVFGLVDLVPQLLALSVLRAEQERVDLAHLVTDPDVTISEVPVSE